MRLRSIVALAVVAYLIFAVVTLPARLVAHVASVPGTIELDDARGTLWNGSAHARVFGVGGSLDLDSITWRFQPARLVAGRIAFAFETQGDAIEGNGRIERGLATWEARDLHAKARAEALTPLAPLAASWRPVGLLDLDVPAFTWDGSEGRGSAEARWREAALAISEVRPLGSYRAQASAEGGPARIVLSTLDGPLRVSGSGTLDARGALTFTGEARSDPASAAALKPLLDLMGPVRADGARSFEWRSAAPPAR